MIWNNLILMEFILFKVIYNVFGVYDVIFSGLFVFLVIGCLDWYERVGFLGYINRGFCKFILVVDNFS